MSLLGQGAASQGGLFCFDRRSFLPVARIPLGPAAAVRVCWNPRINQIAVGMGDGAVRVMYDPAVSTKGALLCAAKAARSSEGFEFANIKHEIYLPTVSETVIDPKTGKRVGVKKEKPADAMKPKAPEGLLMKPGGHGRGGKVSESNEHLLMKQVLAKEVEAGDDWRNEARDAFIKRAKECEENPMYIGNAYAETQPKAIFAKTEEELQQEDDDDDVKNKDKIKSL